MNRRFNAFSLIELLTSITVLALLLGVLLPGLRKFKENSHLIQCAANLRQLAVANSLYASEHNHYVPAARDIFANPNTERWHGKRSNNQSAFDGHEGPLKKYLGVHKKIRRCMSLVEVETSLSKNAFESSCGGYGYNDRGVGSQTYIFGFTSRSAQKGMSPGALKKPVETVMFSDAAFGQPYNNPAYLIEYSFCEAPFFVDDQGNESWRATPSIHFRHQDKTQVAWCDGHLSREEMNPNISGSDKKNKLGWFGPDCNEFFDPR